MQIDYINPFINAATGILKEVLNVNIQQKEMYLKDLASSKNDVLVLIGVNGNVKGHIIFSMELDTALKIVSKMNNETFTELDQMARSTLGELANMISGRVVTLLEKGNLSFGFTPPTIVVGKEINIHTEDANVETLSIPMEIEGMGIIEIIISFKEN